MARKITPFEADKAPKPVDKAEATILTSIKAGGELRKVSPAQFDARHPEFFLKCLFIGDNR